MNKIKQLREDLKMNQTKFAESIGIEQSYLSQIENGKEVSMNVAYKIQKKYSIPVQELLSTKKTDTPNIDGMKREIELLKQIIESQKQTITLLQKNKR